MFARQGLHYGRLAMGSRTRRLGLCYSLEYRLRCQHSVCSQQALQEIHSRTWSTVVALVLTTQHIPPSSTINHCEENEENLESVD